MLFSDKIIKFVPKIQILLNVCIVGQPAKANINYYI